MSSTRQEIKEWLNWLNRKRLWILIVTAIFSLLVLLLWRVPQWGVPDSIVDEKEKAELLNANRDNVFKGIQTIAGLGFILTAYLAWCNYKLTEDKNVTERFSKAVEMLADDKLSVRIGGIYSLERIAKDSAEDYTVVMEVLTAFIREKRSIDHINCSSTTKITQDIQSALTVIGRRKIQSNETRLDLSYTNLRYAKFRIHGLDKANFNRVDSSSTQVCVE